MSGTIAIHQDEAGEKEENRCGFYRWKKNGCGSACVTIGVVVTGYKHNWGYRGMKR